MSVGDWRFELGPAVFGCGTPVDVTGWDMPGADVRDQDQPSGFGDFTVFGVDRLTPETWAFTLTVKERDEASALATLAPLQAAWDAKATRSTPQAVLPLSYRIGGRTRLVFGRPRRFTPVLNNLIFGRVPVAATFALAHVGSFDGIENTAPLSLGAADLSSSGIELPVSFPFLWGGSAPEPRHVTINVGGDRDAFLTATIVGGAEVLTDPYLVVAGRPIDLEGTVAPGETVVVSGAPWDRSFTRLDGTAASLTLSAGSRLADLIVPPGAHEVSFGGVDGSGTATCTVAWRGAYNSI